MKASTTILVSVLTIGSVGLAATSALACHGGSGGYGGGYSSRSYYPEYVRRVYVKEPVIVAPTFAPAHSLVVVMPGDSWFSICSREYGNPNTWTRVADFNGIPQNLPLTNGTQLRLPVINPNGSFSLSSAPAALAIAPQGFAHQQLPMGLPQGAQLGQQVQQIAPQAPMAPQAPQAGPTNIGTVQPINGNQLNNMPAQANGQPAAPNAGPTDRPLPSILIGSVMTINGQQLGDNRGTVRLVVNGSPVALEIVEWSTNGAKVQIPADLPASIQAQIEILRADGSVVTKDAVQLAAAPKVAATN